MMVSVSENTVITKLGNVIQTEEERLDARRHRRPVVNAAETDIVVNLTLSLASPNCG